MKHSHNCVKGFPTAAITLYLLLGIFGLISTGIWRQGAATTPAPTVSKSVAEKSQAISEAIKQQIQETYGTLPMRFEANEGQFDEQVKFITHGSGYTLFLTSNEAVLSLRKSVISHQSSAVSDPKQVSRHQQRAISNPDQSGLLSQQQANVNIDEEGHAILQIDRDEFKLRAPVIYQEIDEMRHPIEGEYVAVGGNKLAFAVAAYDPTLPLVIDPVLQFSAFLRCNDRENASYTGMNIAVDADGYAYIVVETEIDEGFRYVGVIKIAPNGSDVIYVTGLQGNEEIVSSPSSIFIDKVGNAYVAGITNDPDFPTTEGAFDTSYNPDPKDDSDEQKDAPYDAFVTKLDAAGRLVFSTFLGGWSRDGAEDIAVDNAGSVYVTGWTNSPNFPTTVAAFDTSFNGDCDDSNPDVSPRCYSDVFLAKLSADGSSLVYSTFLGGKGSESGSGIALDAAGNAYILGNAGNADFPTTPFAFDEKYNGGSDVFVTKLNAGGSGLVYSTFLGGTANENGYDIVVDADGSVYLTGSTSSSEFPTTAGAFDVSHNGSSDVFVTKLIADGAGLTYSTVIGGVLNEGGTGICTDKDGNAYVTGSTSSSDFPTTLRAFDLSFNGGSDVIVLKLNTNGNDLVYSTFFGGKSGESAAGIALDATGNAYITGGTNGEGFPITAGVIGGVYSEVCDRYGGAFVAKFPLSLTPTIVADAGPDKKTICAGGSVPIGGSPTGAGGSGGPYAFRWTPTTGLNDPNAPNPIASPVTTTTYTVIVTETATGLSATDDVTVTVPLSGWSVAHIVDVDDVIFGINQSATTGSVPRNNRGLALSPDERFLYLGYNPPSNKRFVRKIDLSVTPTGAADPAHNHSAVVAQLNLPSGTEPARDIATDDRGRVYLALGTKIEIYNSNLRGQPLYTIFGFTACEGVATRRENRKLAVYATDRLDKTLERFTLVEGANQALISSSKVGLDGDGEVRIIGANSPRGLDIASDGTAWIADLGKGQVYRVNSAGSTADSTRIRRAIDVAIDEKRGEAYVSNDTLRPIKVLNLSNGRVKRTLTPPLPI